MDVAVLFQQFISLIVQIVQFFVQLVIFIFSLLAPIVNAILGAIQGY